jgi:hypothetical protein
VRDRDGEEIRLFDLLREPRYALLEFTDGPAKALAVIRTGRQRRFLAHFRLLDGAGDAGGMAGNAWWTQADGFARDTGSPVVASYFVRPDGYIAFRGDRDDAGVRIFLDRWLHAGGR